MGELRIGFWWGNLRERYYLEDPDQVDVIKMDPQEVGWGSIKCGEFF